MASSLLNYFTNIKKLNTFFVVDRIELVKQSIDKFEQLKDVHSVIKAGAEFKYLYNPFKPCQLTMLQSWYAKREQYSFLKPDVILIDEIHSGFGTGRMDALFEAYPNAKIIGLSATPIDEKGYLLKGIDKFIETATIKQLQSWVNPQNGLPFLAKDFHYIPEIYDFSGVKTKGSDYDEQALAEEIENNFIIDNIVDIYKNKYAGKKTLGFCLNIEHAKQLDLKCKQAGFTSAVIHSKMKVAHRKIILQYHKEGKIECLWNVGILTTGYDDPTLQQIILTYPTKSLRKYIQMVSSGGRVCPGKTQFNIIDFGMNGIVHGAWSRERIYYEDSNIDIKIFEPFRCPNCFSVVFEKVKNCPECGYYLVTTREYAEREAKEKIAYSAENMKLLQEQRYSDKLSIEMLRELFVIKNESRDVSLFFYTYLKKLQPEKWNEHLFNQELQPIIKKAIDYRHKPMAVYLKFKEKLEKTLYK